MAQAETAEVTALVELRERMAVANVSILELAADATSVAEMSRLEWKAAGLRLAISYLDETIVQARERAGEGHD